MLIKKTIVNNNLTKPKVTVLMPVYNGKKYLGEAIESILNQTFTDFEFLIINDGSTDQSTQIINSFNDLRIKLIKNEENLGLTKSLNKGLDLAKGKYIARMDADDISLPKRLEIQVKFMDNNPSIGITGSWVKIFGEQIKSFVKKFPANSNEIMTLLLFNNALSHPSVIMRKTFLDRNNLKYDETLIYSQDYELWTRAFKHFRISNIKKVLLLYRVHGKRVTQINSTEQRENSAEIKTKQLENLKLIPTIKETSVYRQIYKPEKYEINDFLEKVEKWLIKLKKQNKKIKYYKEPQFSTIISLWWLTVCSVNIDFSSNIWEKYWKSTLRKNLKFNSYNLLIKFFIKSSIKKYLKIKI